MTLTPSESLEEFFLPLSAFDFSRSSKNGCQGLKNWKKTRWIWTKIIMLYIDQQCCFLKRRLQISLRMGKWQPILVNFLPTAIGLRWATWRWNFQMQVQTAWSLSIRWGCVMECVRSWLWLESFALCQSWSLGLRSWVVQSSKSVWALSIAFAAPTPTMTTRLISIFMLSETWHLLHQNHLLSNFHKLQRVEFFLSAWCG